MGNDKEVEYFIASDARYLNKAEYLVVSLDSSGESENLMFIFTLAISLLTHFVAFSLARIFATTLSSPSLGKQISLLYHAY